MPDWHYHANHADGPPRGSKAAAYKDARRLLRGIDPEYAHGDGTSSFQNSRAYGPEYPQVVRCWKSDCTIVREEQP